MPAKLRSERERQDLTVQWIADRVGISKQSVSGFENGQEPPGEEVVAKWIAALKLPTAWADDWADWRAAEKMVTAGKIRMRGMTPEQRDQMTDVIYRMLRGARP